MLTTDSNHASPPTVIPDSPESEQALSNYFTNRRDLLHAARAWIETGDRTLLDWREAAFGTQQVSGELCVKLLRWLGERDQPYISFRHMPDREVPIMPIWGPEWRQKVERLQPAEDAFCLGLGAKPPLRPLRTLTLLIPGSAAPSTVMITLTSDSFDPAMRRAIAEDLKVSNKSLKSATLNPPPSLFEAASFVGLDSGIMSPLGRFWLRSENPPWKRWYYFFDPSTEAIEVPVAFDQTILLRQFGFLGFLAEMDVEWCRGHGNDLIELRVKDGASYRPSSGE